MSRYRPSFLFCHPEPGLSSWRFHPSSPPLPFPAIPFLQRFPTPKWEASHRHSRASKEGALNELEVWHLRASDQANERVRHLLPPLGILRCSRRVLPSCQQLAPLKQPCPRSCGQQSCVAWLCCIFLSRVWLLKQLTYL